MFAPNYARKWSPIGDKLVSSRLHSKVGAAPVGNFAWRKRQRKSPQNGGAEISLMTQSNSLLGRKKFPVRACRELPRTILKLLSCLAHFHSPRGLNPVFSQLAGNLGWRGQIPGVGAGRLPPPSAAPLTLPVRLFTVTTQWGSDELIADDIADPFDEPIRWRPKKGC